MSVDGELPRILLKTGRGALAECKRMGAQSHLAIVAIGFKEAISIVTFHVHYEPSRMKIIIFGSDDTWILLMG